MHGAIHIQTVNNRYSGINGVMCYFRSVSTVLFLKRSTGPFICLCKTGTEPLGIICDGMGAATYLNHQPDPISLLQLRPIDDSRIEPCQNTEPGLERGKDLQERTKSILAKVGHDEAH